MNIDWGTVIIAITTLIGGAFGANLLNSMSAKGKERRQEERRAWIERDLEAYNRRLADEHIHVLRRILINLGIKEGTEAGNFPPLPQYRTLSEIKEAA